MDPRRRAVWLLMSGVLGLGTTLPDGVLAEDLGLEFGLRAGFRQDEIEFETANRFGGTSTAKLEETKVNHLEIFARGDIAEGLTFRGSASFGWVYDGNFQYSGTGDDGPYDPITGIGGLPNALVGTVDGDMAYDVVGGVGYQLKAFEDRLRIAPLGGYTYHSFDIRTGDTTETLLDGFPLGFTRPPAVFETEWKGPWVGVDVITEPVPKLSLIGELQYSWLNFEAQPSVVDPEISSVQRGDGGGFSWTVGVSYRFAKYFTAELRYHSLDWSATTGRQMTVHWQSWHATAGAVLVF
ncbi:hypothetical protein MK489_05500 [Myxococcota bacterium]|nr:hypothetical protein [Myxococcota bacterium]